jgi:hypothetical protein
MVMDDEAVAALARAYLSARIKDLREQVQHQTVADEAAIDQMNATSVTLATKFLTLALNAELAYHRGKADEAEQFSATLAVALNHLSDLDKSSVIATLLGLMISSLKARYGGIDEVAQASFNNINIFTGAAYEDHMPPLVTTAGPSGNPPGPAAGTQGS